LKGAEQMAGTQSEIKVNTDILFDLDLEDNKTLQESELLQLVNFGQLSKPYDFPGVDGKVYTVYFAVLWDDDYLDILQRTTKYAADPILRSRVMRRLIAFKSIQRINNIDFSNPNDVKSKRLLWTMICKMSDIMVQVLEARYKEMELENTMKVMDAMTAISEKMEATKPEGLKKTTTDKAPVAPVAKEEVSADSDAHFAPFSAGNEHVALVEQMKAQQQGKLEDVAKAVETQVILDNKQPLVTSPKKQ
jgi:hypothetical protein